MKREYFIKLSAVLLLVFGMCSFAAAQQFRMSIGGGYARALEPLSNYTTGTFAAATGFEYEASDWFSAGLQFQYSGFPLDTSRLDFASTLIPLSIYGQLQYPVNETIKPYLGAGTGLLFVRYVFSQGISVRETHWQWVPRAGVKFEVDDALQFDLNFSYYQALNQLGKSGEGPELGISDYRYFALTIGLAYTISEG